MSSKSEEPQGPFFATVASNERLTPDDHWQDVRLVTFDVGESDISWKPGDVCYVQPSNLAEDVDELFELLPEDVLRPDDVVRVEARQGEAQPPPAWILSPGGGALTVRDCAERAWDLRALPRRYFFELLSQVSVTFT